MGLEMAAITVSSEGIERSSVAGDSLWGGGGGGSITRKSKFRHAPPALHEPFSYRIVSVSIYIYFVSVRPVLLHKPQLCWHPLCLWSLVYKGLNASLAECKAYGYWLLLTFLFPRCLTVNSVSVFMSKEPFGPCPIFNQCAQKDFSAVIA